MAHTPTPWTANLSCVFSGKNCIAVCDTDNDTRERMQDNAAFIVKAVNAHDDLVAAAKMALRTYERDFPNGQGVIDLRAALAKAECK
jgi:hypothetical protein